MNPTSVVKVVLASDPAGLINGFAQADTASKKFGQSVVALNNLGKAAFNGLIGAIGKVETGLDRALRRAKWTGIGMGTSLAAASFGAIKLEAAMRNVATIDTTLQSGIGGAQNQIINLSRILPKSAQDIAEGYYDIASSGFTGAKGIQVLTAAVRAGSAGLASTAEAGQAITSVLNAYGLSAANASKVSDELFQTVNFGVVTFSELTGVVGDTVGLAAQAGVPFKDVGAALATMTLTGISAAESGTALNRVLQSFVQPSEALAEAWKRISPNMSLLDALKDKSIGLYGVIDKLRVASQGNIEVLMSWFDEIRAGKGALALMSADGETYKRIQQEMNDTTGATTRAFEQQMESTQASIQKFINQMKSIGLEVGVSFLGPIKRVTDALTYFAGAWNVIPRPIKTLISYGYALSAMMLVVAGLFGMWALKGMLMRTVMQSIGGQVVALSTRMKGLAVAEAAYGKSNALAAVGSRWTGLANVIGNAGTRIQSSSGSYLNPFRALNSLSNTVITSLARLGGALGRLPGPLGALGAGFTRLSGGLQTAKTLLPVITLGLAGLAVAGIAAFAAINSLTKSADTWAQTKVVGNRDLDTFEGLSSAITHSDEVMKKAREGAKSYTADVGGFFRAYTGAIGHAVFSIVGAGEAIDNPLQKMSRVIAVMKKQEALIKSQNSLADITGRVFQRVTDTKGFERAVSIMGTGQDSLHQNMNLVLKAANKLGISISDSSKLGKKEIKALSETYLELRAGIGGAQQGTNDFTVEAQKNIKKLQKYFEETQENTAKNWNKAFDISGAVQDFGSEGTAQLTKYLDETSGKAELFVNEIDDLMRRGLDPQVLYDLAVAGPAAAGAAVDAIAGPTDDKMIELVNNTSAHMRELRVRLQSENDLIAKAALNPQWAGELGTALDIKGAMLNRGNRATPDQIAFALGLDVATVNQVAGHFGITLNDTLKAKFKERLMADSVFGQVIWSNINKSLAETSNSVGENTAGDIWKTFYDKGAKAAIAFTNGLDMSQADKDVFIRLIGEAEVQGKLAAIKQQLGDLSTPQWSIAFQILTADDPEKKLKEVKAQAQELGLTPAQLKVIADIAEAETGFNNVKTKKKELEADPAKVYVEAHTGSANSKLDEIAQKLRNMDGSGATVHVTTVESKETKNAHGNIFRRFANGGESHVAQISAGVTRIWAEPETGGEAYIPLAVGKRDRSTAILREVASLFGYNLVRSFADGGMMPAVATRAGGVSGGSRTVIHKTTIEFSGPVYGVDEFARIANELLDRRDEEVAIRVGMDRG